jgi:hypothetical protein
MTIGESRWIQSERSRGFILSSVGLMFERWDMLSPDTGSQVGVKLVIGLSGHEFVSLLIPLEKYGEMIRFLGER